MFGRSRCRTLAAPGTPAPDPTPLRAVLDDALTTQEGPGTTEHPSGEDLTN